VHLAGADLQDCRCAAPLANLACGGCICGKVDVVPLSFDEAVRADRVEKARRRAVEKDLRWGLGLVFELDRKGMPLACSDSQSVFADGEALLVVTGHDLGKAGGVEWCPVGIERLQENGNIDPSVRGESDPEAVGAMPQYEAEKPPDSRGFLRFAHGGGLSSPAHRSHHHLDRPRWLPQRWWVPVHVPAVRRRRPGAVLQGSARCWR